MDGFVSLQEYMAFMISRETENIQSISDIIQAFRALTHEGEKPYITSAEIYAVSNTPRLLLTTATYRPPPAAPPPTPLPTAPPRPTTAPNQTDSTTIAVPHQAPGTGRCQFSSFVVTE